jgi:hypothetical protein
MGVHPEPLHRLTGLYVIAQFSERAISDQHRMAAVRALEESLGGLRRLGGRPDVDVLWSFPSEVKA